MAANVRVYNATLEINTTGVPTVPAKVRVYEAQLQIQGAIVPIPAAAKVRVYEAYMTIDTGTAPIANPAKVRVYEAQLKIQSGPPVSNKRTGWWMYLNGQLVPVKEWVYKSDQSTLI